MNTKFASATTNETNANEAIATNEKTTTTNTSATATTTNVTNATTTKTNANATTNATNVTNATTTNANANATTNATNVTNEATNEATTTKSFTNVMILVAIDHEHVIVLNDSKKEFVSELSSCESQYVDTKKSRTSHERKIR
jgi:cell wall-associated NlpC family hydrolase